MNDEKNIDATRSSRPTSEKAAKKGRATVDIAVFITVGSGVLYLLGWIYWTHYFKYFGIDPSFIDLSFHQIIATTWWFAIAFAMIIYAIMDNEECIVEPENRVSISVFNILLIIFGALSALLSVLPMPLWSKIAVAIVLIGILIAFKPVFKRKKINFAKKKDRIIGKLEIVILLFILALLFNTYLGTNHAVEKSNITSNSDRITLYAKNGIKAPEKAVLIAHMKGKYFICKPVKMGERPETIVISDAMVEKAAIWTSE